MKSKLLLFALLISSLLVKSQEFELGVSFGAMQYQGDLAQPPVAIRNTKFNIGALARYTFNPKLAIRGEVNFGKIGGDDKYAVGEEHLYRNLNFSSPIFEVSGSLEYNFFKFVPGSLRKRFTPYISAGVGIFHFDPTTTYKGSKIHLQPLQTELNKPLYSLTQVCFPVGVGIKWSVGKLWTIGAHYATRFTLTDYLDDVSHNWQTSKPGTIDQDLTYRGDETNNAKWVGYAPYIINENNPNDKRTVNRGDPRNRDTYLFFGFSITKTFRKFSCNAF